MNVATNLQAVPPAVAGCMNTGPDERSASLAGTAGKASAGISMVQTRSAEVALETMEGDRVTLSFSSRTEAGYQLYNAQGGLDGTAPASLERFTLSSGTRMSIVVEGEISEAEKADIETVMSAVEEMAEEFFEGDVDEALAELMKMGETTSIAGLQVTLESSRSFGVSYGDGPAPAIQGAGGASPQAVVADGGRQAGVPVGTQTASGATSEAGPAAPAASTTPAASGAPATSTAPAAPASLPTTADPNTQAVASDPTTPIATEEAVDASAQTGRITFEGLRGFVSSMTGVIEGSGIDLSKSGKHMLKIMDHLLDKIAEDFGFGEEMHKLAEVVKAEFAGRIEEMDGHDAHEAHEAEGDEDGHAREMKDAHEAHGHRDKHDRDHDHGHRDRRGHEHGHEHEHGHKDKHDRGHKKDD